jgi:hypothetical protein
VKRSLKVRKILRGVNKDRKNIDIVVQIIFHLHFYKNDATLYYFTSPHCCVFPLRRFFAFQKSMVLLQNNATMAKKMERTHQYRGWCCRDCRWHRAIDTSNTGVGSLGHHCFTHRCFSSKHLHAYIRRRGHESTDMVVVGSPTFAVHLARVGLSLHLSRCTMIDVRCTSRKTLTINFLKKTPPFI